MQPEPFTTFRQALRFGPGHCPPDLFEGTVPAIVRGLKVHANNVSHARRVALEETYRRLVLSMGPDAFHQAAEMFLQQGRALGSPLDRIGDGFARLLENPVHRDLARAEWAWLEAFHAGEGEALALADLASMKAEAVVEARFSLHPAAQAFALETPEAFAWDEPVSGNGEALLLTRPGTEVMLWRVDAPAVRTVALLAGSPPTGELIGADAASLITLIGAGAILLEGRQ